jgi:hypothetical protein
VKYDLPPSPSERGGVSPPALSERGGVSPLAFGEGSGERWLTVTVAQLVANSNAKRKKSFFIIVIFKSPPAPKGGAGKRVCIFVLFINSVHLFLRGLPCLTVSGIALLHSFFEGYCSAIPFYRKKSVLCFHFQLSILNFQLFCGFGIVLHSITFFPNKQLFKTIPLPQSL